MPMLDELVACTLIEIRFGVHLLDDFTLIEIRFGEPKFDEHVEQSPWTIDVVLPP